MYVLYEELVVLKFRQVQRRGVDIRLGPVQHVNSNAENNTRRLADSYIDSYCF
jgi:hypothetical protein